MSTQYQLTATDVVIRKSDGFLIPNDAHNRDRAAYDAYVANGGTVDPAPTPQAPTPSFLARELFGLLTVDDYSAIKSAVASSDALGLLWDSLKAQGDAPILISSARFQQGWHALKQVIGDSRGGVIAAALGIPL